MIVDGRQIANVVYRDVARIVSSFSTQPTMAVITCAPNPETEQYLALKKRKATEVGIILDVIELPETATTDDVVQCIKITLPKVAGIVVQLPLPSHIDRETVLLAIPGDKDPDGFGYAADMTTCVPPVVAAIAEISAQHSLDWKDKKVVVVGYGRLVGKPVAQYAESLGAIVTILTEASDAFASALLTADILISGVGKPHFISEEMVKDGVVIFDAGASEDGGVVVGDVHPAVAEKASLFTPVPGGIGPITVAALLRNLVSLVRQYE